FTELALSLLLATFYFFSSRRRHTRFSRDWSSDVCSSDYPLPTHGGMMDSHIFRKAAFRLPALADLAVLRFNTRGTASEAGRSEGSFDGGNSERFDVAAALEYAEFNELPRVWLVGWSFGTDLTLVHGL